MKKRYIVRARQVGRRDDWITFYLSTNDPIQAEQVDSDVTGDCARIYADHVILEFEDEIAVDEVISDDPYQTKSIL